MNKKKNIRLGSVARKLNIGTTSIVNYLEKIGFKIINKPNTKITLEQFNILASEFINSAIDKKEASKLNIGNNNEINNTDIKDFENKENIKVEKNTSIENAEKDTKDIEQKNTKVEDIKENKENENNEKNKENENRTKLTVIGKIQLPKLKKNKFKKKKNIIVEKKINNNKIEKNTILKTPSTYGTQVKTTPSYEAQVKSTITYGAQAKTATPYGAQFKTPTPYGAQAKITPTGTQAKTTTPYGAQFKTPTPYGAQFKTPTPYGAQAKTATPYGAQAKTTTPYGAQAKTTTPYGAQFKTSTPYGARFKTSPAYGAQFKKKDVKFNNNFSNIKKEKESISEKEIQEQIKTTLAKINKKKNESNKNKYRKEKKSAIAELKKKKITKLNENKKILKITKFISTNDLASLMNVPINKIISTCMSLGIITSINQRLDEETIIILADEFGYNIEFTELKEEYNDYNEIEERKEKIEKRPPIITIMGHVDHGKTSLLNYIKNKKKSNKKEIGNITQHIGAYSIKIKNKEKISFLDTPGHEAFTAMRARGVKVTDIAVIVIAADDGVKLQTKEAINHAKTARVPIIIAINKSDKEEANPSKIKEELANINILVEEWGGKYQSQEISAITGKGIDELLEKIIIEAELLELKVNVNKNATGAIIESSLNKGRGYESIILIQSGTLKIGDKIVSGIHYGKIKAMFNYEGLKINKAKPSESIRIIGLNGAPQAGDVFKVMNTDKKIKEIAKKREQIIRDQNLKTRMNINLNEVKNKLSNDETLKELNIIIKGDVNGSIEAIADSLLKLSIEEIKINIIHKGIGQISESDVLLASTSNSMIIGFQVKLSNKARKISKKEEIKVKMYSIIYDIIDDIKESIEKILSSKKKEIVTGSMKIKEIFKISNIKTIAGCYVTDGYIKKINKVKVVRDDVVIHIGKIKELKRFKDEIKEIKHGFECGINIENFNNVKIDDIIESFE